jgi:hypothetical protein
VTSVVAVNRNVRETGTVWPCVPETSSRSWSPRVAWPPLTADFLQRDGSTRDRHGDVTGQRHRGRRGRTNHVDLHAAADRAAAAAAATTAAATTAAATTAAAAAATTAAAAAAPVARTGLTLTGLTGLTLTGLTGLTLTGLTRITGLGGRPGHGPGHVDADAQARHEQHDQEYTN